MTIMKRNKKHVETACESTDTIPTEERILPLPPHIYHALSGRKSEISGASSSHIVWEDETCSMLLIGSRTSVEETAFVLRQFVSSGVNRKLTRSPPETVDHRPTANIDAANLLLMSGLPPELTISSTPRSLDTADKQTSSETRFSQFSGLPGSPAGYNLNNLQKDSFELRSGDEADGGGGRFARRKLEPEDSSYDSDHESVTFSRSTDSSTQLSIPSTNQLASRFSELTTDPDKLQPQDLTARQFHDDLSRSHSETLGQEFAEYITSRSKLGSRDSSPTLSERLEVVPEQTGLNNEDRGSQEDIQTITQHPKYYNKVEFALKLGYPEPLTQRALLKIGMGAQQNELLDELIRLQQIKCVDPKELLLKEAHELLSTTLSLPVMGQLSRTASETSSSSSLNEATNLKPIVIDGSNVAMSHGNKEKFSCLGIQICVNWFKNRGHKDITVFVPKWRKESSKPDSPTTQQHILTQLEKERLLIFTPSRQVGGRRVVCLDDRFILNLAAETDAVVVSNDNFRELINDKPEFRKVIEERILMYSFVNDRFMPPDDPLGRNGPTLDNFLRRAPAHSDLPPPCPYGKKCTYGNKCKFYHAERGTVPHKSVTDRLKEQSIRKIMEVRTRNTSRDSSPGGLDLTRAKSMNPALHRTESDTSAFNRPKQSLARTRSTDVSGLRGYRPTAGLRMSSGSGVDAWPGGASGNLELGCLNNYGLGGLLHHSAPPPPLGPWNTLVPPPPAQPSSQETNSHRRLERQLTINPAFDPRINKPRFPKNHEILSTAAMEYMHRNPPPPLGLPPTLEHGELTAHQNVTRIASAPDSIRQWGSNPAVSAVNSPPVAVVEPLGLGVNEKASSVSPMQRNNSTSDTQLNRTLSADPGYAGDTWKYRATDTGISPILPTNSGSIWGPLTSPKLETPPPSPGQQSKLGPVGSRPGKDERLELRYHLSALFPPDQVEIVMKQLPEEQNPKALCAAIMKQFPPA